jgi:hypothetical protein
MPNPRGSNKKTFGLVVLAVLLIGGGLAWLERAPLLAWFYVHRLARAGEGDRERWAERVAGLEEAALPGLLDCLTREDETACGNAREALIRMCDHWGRSNARTAALAARVARDFPRLSRQGRQNVLAVATGWFPPGEGSEPPAAGLFQACVRLVQETVSTNDPEIRGPAMELCGRLLGQGREAECLNAGRELARACLADPSPANRVRAVQLALHPGMELLEQVAALLNDPAPEVRRAAMLAVGPAEKVVRDETLLPSLHDPDPDVRDLCRAALRGRGLGPEHLKLGELLTDPSPAVRLEVLDHLYQVPNLDPTLWLRRLSHDPAPGVRAAAVRVMSQRHGSSLCDRIDQMARGDPSPSVCQVAQYYLKALKSSNEDSPDQ